MSEPFDADKLIVSWVKELAPYVPGEQPQTQGWVKLNTNENPYPASPKIAQSIQEQINMTRGKSTEMRLIPILDQILIWEIFQKIKERMI